jgi:nicotinamidase-related amidase
MHIFCRLERLQIKTTTAEDNMTEAHTLRGLVGLPAQPAKLSESALIMIDCQNTYTRGIMKLEGVEAAMNECQAILKRARAAGAPVIHIRHEAGAGSPYDTNAEIGQIADAVAPIGQEHIITKNYPSSFERTELDGVLKKLGAKNLIYAGFMTHMCINSTARAGFNHGYSGTVIANATATRRLPNPNGGEVAAKDLHRAALAMVADLFAIVVPNGKMIAN